MVVTDQPRLTQLGPTAPSPLFPPRAKGAERSPYYKPSASASAHDLVSTPPVSASGVSSSIFSSFFLPLLTVYDTIPSVFHLDPLRQWCNEPKKPACAQAVISTTFFCYRPILLFARNKLVLLCRCVRCGLVS